MSIKGRSPLREDRQQGLEIVRRGAFKDQFLATDRVRKAEAARMKCLPGKVYGKSFSIRAETCQALPSVAAGLAIQRVAN